MRYMECNCTVSISSYIFGLWISSVKLKLTAFVRANDWRALSRFSSRQIFSREANFFEYKHAQFNSNRRRSFRRLFSLRPKSEFEQLLLFRLVKNRLKSCQLGFDFD